MRQIDTVVTIRCLADNYTYLVHDPASKETVLIDVPDAAPVLAELDRRGWTLTHVLLTHHHWDHVDGLDALRAACPQVHVTGARADAHRLPPLDRAVAPGEVIAMAAGDVTVIDAPGHTLGQVAYHLPARDALFSGDSLMVHGCGRLFEGTAAQMFDTCTRLNRLPETTRLFSGHDYAAANLGFAARFAPDARALAQRRAELDMLEDEGWPTTGVTLASERLLNPYLRCHLPDVAAAAGLHGATASEVFARIRALKDAA